MSDYRKQLAASIIKFLRTELCSGKLSAEICESLEVAIQCLEVAYDVGLSDLNDGVEPLLEIYTRSLRDGEDVSESSKALAELLKNRGNELMKADNYMEALDNYTRAIALDGRNAVFYGNRAAAYSKLNIHEAAIKDCHTALSIDPTYSKAHGRLGLAYSSLNRHTEALASYRQALEMEPDNESYRNNLTLAEEKIASASGAGPSGSNSRPNTSASPFDIGMLLNNPTLMNMATQMLTDPAMQNMMSGLISGTAPGGAIGMDALLEAGQQLAQQMQTNNPELVHTLRQQMAPGGDGDGNNPRNNEEASNTPNDDPPSDEKFNPPNF